MRRARAPASTPAAMLEEELLGLVLELAGVTGWLCFHPRPARTQSGWRTAGQGNGAVGFPDLTLARRGRVIFAELKREAGKLTPGQVAWRVQLDGGPARETPVYDEGVPTERPPSPEWYLWRPSRWFDGTIETVLR